MKIENIIIIIVILITIITSIYGICQLRTNQLCLENGWKEGKITWNLDTYCCREENEYEIVKPLNEIRKK